MSRRGFFLRLVYCVVGMVLCTSTTAQQMRLEVIELHSRSADELIPVLEPMLAPGGQISGIGDKLVIRSTPVNLAELRSMLATLDAPPGLLRITVRQTVGATALADELEVAGAAGRGDVRVVVPDSGSSSQSGASIERRRGSNHARARVNRSRSETSGNTLQTVQVIEGRAAFITIGSSVPVRSRTRSTGPDGVTVVESTQYRDIGSGFYALARIDGDRVTVELATSADTVIDNRTGAARIQRVSSVVSGKVGQWLELGAIIQNSEGSSSGVVTHRSHTADDQRTVHIKVDRVR